jgi:hypothetical protein
MSAAKRELDPQQRGRDPDRSADRETPALASDLRWYRLRAPRGAQRAFLTLADLAGGSWPVRGRPRCQSRSRRSRRLPSSVSAIWNASEA